MCLTISKIHKNNNNKPFIAEKDIIVFKALDHYDLNNRKKVFCTPYQYYPIDFIDGKCVMKSDLYMKSESNCYFVSIGIHSFRDEESAKVTCAGFPETKMTKHWAIIPKGSKYYIGDNNDIVSDNLIIFRTREDFREYKKEHSCSKLNLKNEINTDIDGIAKYINEGDLDSARACLDNWKNELQEI